VRRRTLHHFVERGAPVVQPQIEACRSGLLTDELLVGGIQSNSHRRELRDRRGQQGDGEVAPAEFAKDLEFLPEIGSVIPVSRRPSLSPPARKKSVVCGSNAMSPDFTRAAKSRT
jgi:hypothetical protein